MRFEKQGWVFAQTPIWATCDFNISDGAYRLFTYLDWRQGNDDYCWPSLARIARDLNLSRSTVRRRLRELEQAGYLITRHRVGRSSQYSLVADPDNASDKHTPTPGTPDGGQWFNPDGGGRSNLPHSPGRKDGTIASEATCTSVGPDGHDDRKGQEKKDKEKQEAQLAGWLPVLAALRQQMTASSFDQWLADSTACREGDTVVVQLADERSLEWVSNRFGRTVRRTVRRVFGEDDLVVTYEVRGR